MKSFINKKSQAWMFDLVVGLSLLIVIIVVFFIYSLNNSSETNEILQSLDYEGNLIMNNILSEGYPNDWNKISVLKIGILSDNKINQTKIEKFYNLTINEYPKTKSLFNTKYNYYFFMNINVTIEGIEVEGIGKPGININNISSTNLIKITRYTVYKEKPVTTYLYVWE